MTRQLPDETNLGLSYGAYISWLREAGSYHWYSDSATVHQVRDYVWELMGLTDREISFDWPLSPTFAGDLSFAGVMSEAGVSVISCFWSTESGADRIIRAAQREWDEMLEAMRRGVFFGHRWGMRSTLMMHGVIDSQQGLPELYDYLQDGRIVRLGPEEDS